MIYRGTVRAGVIVLEPGVEVAEGREVLVEIPQADRQVPSTERDPVFTIQELAVETGVPDLATNIDHYLYGNPRVDDGR